MAPAGGEDSLRAAVFSGADAVYLGGQAFGARANAKNFSREELRRAVAFCHARGVKVYVTVNTLIKEKEMPAALEFAKFLCEISVDAVLVQDIGLFSLLRQCAPELPLHASTQMSLHTPDGVRLLYGLGAKRAVLARELSLQEIREISRSCPIELEAFVHGALCMSVSGQCYLSAMLGGRSGNRGMCAQPCRLPFGAPGGTGHDLSLKDLSFLREVEELRRAGVCSAKIEGRMKRPEYVTAAVSACRMAAEGGEIPQELLDNLEAVFSRSGFTQGYLTGKLGGSMFGIRRKEDVTGATERVFSALRQLYRGERSCVPVVLALREAKEEIELTVRDEDGHAACVRCPAVRDAVPLSGERCLVQLKKTGGTPFYPKEAAVPEDGAAVTVSGLNSLRREALEELLQLRGKRGPIPFETRLLKFSAHVQRTGEHLPLRVSFSRTDQIFDAAKGCEAVQLPLSTDKEELQRLRDRGFRRILLELPRAMFGVQEQVERMLLERMELGFREVVCGNLGALETARRAGAVLHGAFSLNIANTASLSCLEQLGLSSAELSFELTGKELSSLGGSLPRGVMVYGRQALMLLRNCPLANTKRGCLGCGAPGMLTDRMHKNFPVLCTRGGGTRVTELLNSVPLWISLGEKDLRAVDFGLMRFTVENSVECESIYQAFLRQEPPGFDCTHGLFFRGVE